MLKDEKSICDPLSIFERLLEYRHANAGRSFGGAVGYVIS